jgi:trimethylamine monooxygenase
LFDYIEGRVNEPVCAIGLRFGLCWRWVEKEDGKFSVTVTNLPEDHTYTESFRSSSSATAIWYYYCRSFDGLKASKAVFCIPTISATPMEFKDKVRHRRWTSIR